MREITGKFGAGLNASCGTDEALAFYRKHGQFDILYTDPPWGSANLRYFQKAAMAGSQLTEKGLAERLSLIVEQHIARYAFILMGNNQVERIRNEMQTHARRVTLLPVKYWLTDRMVKAGNPATLKDATLIIVEKPKAPSLPGSVIAQGKTKYAFDLVEHFVRASGAPAKMLDCCAGFGRYLEVAKKCGWRCYGSEINPTRFESLKEVVTGEVNPKADNLYKARA